MTPRGITDPKRSTARNLPRREDEPRRGTRAKRDLGGDGELVA
jgi:hypothetical protein